MKKGLEIERKYLISFITEEELRKQAGKSLRKIKIDQLYLVAEEGERRVRKTDENGEIHYFYTEKRPITGLKRKEKEYEISEQEYKKYRKEADSSCYEIRKCRYKFMFDGQLFELDIYEFSNEKAILEIELPAEDTQVNLPPFIEVVRDVTYEKQYKNKALAKTQSLG